VPFFIIIANGVVGLGNLFYNLLSLYLRCCFFFFSFSFLHLFALAAIPRTIGPLAQLVEKKENIVRNGQ
jgi:hypothetical protein